ncbi:MAG: two-component system sensor histidine kinase CreC, partial [Desulfobacterales bacterium]|nr:two-component system sensor histidine kinase CreC [Desulfobacterales bacterium]
MRLRTKLLITYFLFFIPAFFYLTTDFQDNLKFRYLEGVEETLVDQSRVMAGIVATDFKGFSGRKLGDVFHRVYEERFTARIYQLVKTHVDMRVYLTDHKGRLLFDSLKRDPPGTDYSRWRDVFLTLRGEYGARSSKDDPDRPAMSTLYVAAPVIVGGRIQGVLTLGKPTASINDFLAFAKQQILRHSLIAAFLALLLSILTMFVITRPLDHLSRYVKSVRAGTTEETPAFGSSDIGEVGKAFEKIRADLEAKQYVEEYVQSLTHEIKSPVSAIAGAAELLEEEVPPEQQARFLANIKTESRRIQTLVDRMLALSSLEHRSGLEKAEDVDINKIIEAAVQASGREVEEKALQITITGRSESPVKGDAFLLEQAVSNLLRNAVEFSPQGGDI